MKTKQRILMIDIKLQVILFLQTCFEVIPFYLDMQCTLCFYSEEIFKKCVNENLR